MSARTSEAGFTLLETLVAVFALALLMSAGSVLLTSTLKTRQVVEERLEQLGKLEVATAHLRADLANSVPRLSRSAALPESSQGFYGGARGQDNIILGLLRSGRTNIDNLAARSQLLTVRYQYIEGQLVRRIYESPDLARQTPKYETVLVDGLQSIDVLFAAGNVSAPIWEPLIQDGVQTLPNAVTVIMTFETGERLEQSFLVGAAA